MSIAVPLLLLAAAAWLAADLSGRSGEARAAMGSPYRCVFVSASLGTGVSNWKRVNDTALARDVERALENLAEDGYEAIAITPIAQGRHESERVRDGAWGTGFGMTQGVLISATRR